MPSIEASRPSLAWYALYTRHQHEKTVGRILSNKGFNILLPVYKSARRWKDRTKIITLPLFPCYLFLKSNLERRRDILGTPGIHDIVSSGGHPIPIPSAEIEAIQKALGSGLQLEPHPFIKVGEMVTIKDGPLTGVRGVFVRKKNLCRVILSVEILGKAAAVEIDALMIDRINNSSLRLNAAGLYTPAETYRPSLAV